MTKKELADKIKLFREQTFGGDEIKTITVWKDGTYKEWRSRDAEIARDDPDWLSEIRVELSALTNTGLVITCDFCHEQLPELGGILISPPDENGKVRIKEHLCKACFEKLTNLKPLDKDRLWKALKEELGINYKDITLADKQLIDFICSHFSKPQKEEK